MDPLNPSGHFLGAHGSKVMLAIYNNVNTVQALISSQTSLCDCSVLVYLRGLVHCIWLPGWWIYISRVFEFIHCIWMFLVTWAIRSHLLRLSHACHDTGTAECRAGALNRDVKCFQFSVDVFRSPANFSVNNPDKYCQYVSRENAFEKLGWDFIWFYAQNCSNSDNFW